MGKKKEKKKKDIGTILIMSLSVITGGAVGFWGAKVGLDRERVGGELGIFVFLGLLVVSYFMHVIIHELGHLVCGLCSGYEFVSFRIGTMTLIREEGKFKRKKYNIPGTGGQCLMIPPEIASETCPYKLYNLGGIIFDIIASGIGAIGLLLFRDNAYAEMFFVIFTVYGIILALSNGIPLKVKGITNDGYNMWALGKDEEARRAFYIMLRVSGLLSKGIKMKEMPKEWFVIKEDADLSNPMIQAIKIFRGNLYFETLDFEGTNTYYKSLLENEEMSLLSIYEKELQCEVLFFEIVGECRKEIVEQLYTKELQQFIKSMRCMAGKQKLMYAYALIIEKDLKKAEKIWLRAMKLKDTYPIKAELEVEMQALYYVREHFYNAESA